jgi:putative ABC transport system permease protein
MITIAHFLRLAVRNLARGGQRVLVAFLCITFSVTALVALTMIAKSIESAVVLTPAQVVGGDLSLVRQSGDPLHPQDILQLDELKRSGAISDYTQIAFNSSSLMFRTAGSGEMRFAGTGMGIEPGKYPLAGMLSVGQPAGAHLSDLLDRPGDMIITRDLAGEYGLKLGDRIVLTDLRAGAPLEGTLVGIAYDTPNHQGSKIYYSLETAQALAGSEPAANTVIANTRQGQAAAAELEQTGWTVDWAAWREEDKTANAWVIGLRGAGILGLLVGGIGIANTMQVLLRRRQREMAVWKTLGYQAGHLRLVFTLEAGLLGLAGSLLGAALGVFASTGLLEAFRRVSSLLYQWTFSPIPPLVGILVGTATTVIFALWAIALSGQASPMALLREEPVDARRAAGCQPLGLAPLLALPFTALAALVMESALAGVLVLAFILAGIVGLGGFFQALLWIFTRAVPRQIFPLAAMASKNLRRENAAMVFAMIAIFCGVLSMSLGLAVTQISGRRISGGPAELQGYNLTVLAPADQEPAIRAAVDAQQPEKVGVGYRTALSRISIDGGTVSGMDAILVGRSDPQDYVMRGAEWGSQPDGVYVPKSTKLSAGTQLQVTFRDGTTQAFTIAGTYKIDNQTDGLYPPSGLLMTNAAFTRAARADTVTYFVQMPSERLSGAAASLGKALPQATVLDLVAYAGRFMQDYRRLYVLAFAMAGLALLAGLLLVANSASLAVLERRYEIGILKTTGYSRGEILSIFGMEFGLAGLLATGTGVAIVQGMLALAAIASHAPVELALLGTPALLLVAVCGVGLTLLVVAGVAWTPTRISPIYALNERN